MYTVSEDRSSALFRRGIIVENSALGLRIIVKNGMFSLFSRKGYLMHDTQALQQWILGYQAPCIAQDLSHCGASVRVQHSDGLQVTIGLSYPFGEQSAWSTQLCQDLQHAFGLAQPIHITLVQNIRARAITNHVKRHPNVRNVIAVGAGKGGVGKSTVAVRLAESLLRQGARVGILDADVYGPNVVHMLGEKAPTESLQMTDLQPIQLRGLTTISMGQWVARHDAIAWRGPMVGKVLEQLYFGVEWPELDYLVVDLPPGTGDAMITMGKKLPLTAALVVTTPQTVACMDAEKAVAMFHTMQVPVVGFVNNMASYRCEACQHVQDVFPGLSEQRLAEKLGVPCLVELPLDQHLAQRNEQGKALGAAQADADLLAHFESLAQKVSLALCSMKKDYSLMMPDVEVQQGSASS